MPAKLYLLLAYCIGAWTIGISLIAGGGFFSIIIGLAIIFGGNLHTNRILVRIVS